MMAHRYVMKHLSVICLVALILAGCSSSVALKPTPTATAIPPTFVPIIPTGMPTVVGS